MTGVADGGGDRCGDGRRKRGTTIVEAKCCAWLAGVSTGTAADVGNVGDPDGNVRDSWVVSIGDELSDGAERGSACMSYAPSHRRVPGIARLVVGAVSPRPAALALSGAAPSAPSADGAAAGSCGDGGVSVSEGEQQYIEADGAVKSSAASSDVGVDGGISVADDPQSFTTSSDNAASYGTAVITTCVALGGVSMPSLPLPSPLFLRLGLPEDLLDMMLAALIPPLAPPVSQFECFEAGVLKASAADLAAVSAATSATAAFISSSAAGGSVPNLSSCCTCRVPRTLLINASLRLFASAITTATSVATTAAVAMNRHRNSFRCRDHATRHSINSGVPRAASSNSIDRG